MGLTTLNLSILSSTRSRHTRYVASKVYLSEYDDAHNELIKARSESSSKALKELVRKTKETSQTNTLVLDLLNHVKPSLRKRIYDLKTIERKQVFHSAIETISRDIDQRLTSGFSNEPLVRERVSHKKALSHVTTQLSFLKGRRKSISKQWDIQYESLSWWDKYISCISPDFSEMDDAIKQLKSLRAKLKQGAHADISKLELKYKLLGDTSRSRVAELRSNTDDLLQSYRLEDNVTTSTLKKSLWLSAMSVPVSAWLDVDRTLDVYDALRQVNQNYADLSSAEIFIQTLFMSSESLDGLSALVKGAYFEQLVAADTGGELHEHFNNPDTDIVMDGIAYQLKATDSVSYIESVDGGIPVIATSEVANLTDAIDSGYTNEELSHTVDLSLGGPVVDIGDTSVDALLSGLGGLGFFATLKGINHASEKYKNGGEPVEAVFEGAGVAIEGTARSLVGAAEMGYNVITSKPSRFIGRSILKGANKLDKKISGN